MGAKHRTRFMLSIKSLISFIDIDSKAGKRCSFNGVRRAGINATNIFDQPVFVYRSNLFQHSHRLFRKACLSSSARRYSSSTDTSQTRSVSRRFSIDMFSRVSRLSFLMKDIELVAYVLAEFKDECPYLCRVFKILNCRHPVTYGFIRCFSISYCHSRIIKAVCKPP